MKCPFCNQPVEIRIVSFSCEQCNILIRADDGNSIQTIIFPLLHSTLKSKFIQLSVYYKSKMAILSGRRAELNTKIPFEYAKTITPANIVQKLQTYLVFS